MKKQHLFDDPKNTTRVLRLLFLLCALLLVLDFILHRHVSHPFESIPGFYPLYGFIGCVLLVVIAKWLRKLLMRPESYYEAIEERPEQSSIDKKDKDSHDNNGGSNTGDGKT